MSRKIHDYGPSMLNTVEVGDVFVARKRPGREMTIVVKEYLDDLSIRYHYEANSGTWKSSSIHENTLVRPSSGYVRIRKAPRHQVDVVIVKLTKNGVG